MKIVERVPHSLISDRTGTQMGRHSEEQLCAQEQARGEGLPPWM